MSENVRRLRVEDDANNYFRSQQNQGSHSQEV